MNEADLIRQKPGAASNAAARWAVRHDRDEMSATERQAFQEWLAVPGHRDAYTRVRDLWHRFDASLQTPALEQMRREALQTRAPRPWRSAAAVLLLSALAAGLGLLWMSREALVARRDGQMIKRYSAEQASPFTVTLSDGTVATLNRDTVLESRFSRHDRRVRLLHGQAFFAVAKDRSKPFSVEAADERVIAVGTEFGVRLDADRLEVVLLEGKVSIEPAGASGFHWLQSRHAAIGLVPDQRFIASKGKPIAISSVNAASLMSWRRGWVVFENDTLSDAVTELNRYSSVPIVVSGVSAGAMRLSGVFKIGQPDRFAATIQEVLPVTVEQDGAGRIIIRSVEEK